MAVSAAQKQRTSTTQTITPTKTTSTKTTTTPKTSTSATDKAMAGITSDLNKLTGLLAQYGKQVAAQEEQAKTTETNANDAVLQAVLAGQQTAAANAAAAAQAERQSAYDILSSEFTKYGLQALVEPLKGFITSGSSPAELTIQLQNTDAYKKRFAANADRIAKGLGALTPAEYIAMEDQYQNIMRNYGLPAAYYAKDSLGTQAGFQQLLANDVSAVELEDRVTTAQNRVMNANPEVKASLRNFYPDITDGDMLAYALDPTKALNEIKRKVTAAEIGGAQAQAGLSQAKLNAEALAAAGVTGQQYQQQAGTIAELATRGGVLADIYKIGPYGQTQAEAEVFNVAGQTDAAAQRKKITALEKAAFSGQSGAAQGALNRERAMSSGSYRSGAAGAI